MTIEVACAAGSLPIDLILITVGVSPAGQQRGLVAIQAGPGPLESLASLPDQSKRLFDPSVSASPKSTTPRVDLVLQGIKPTLALVRDVVPLVRDVVAFVGATVALIRDTITPESSTVTIKHVPALPRPGRAKPIRLTNPPTARPPVPSNTSQPGPTVKQHLGRRRAG